jgi:hypothetical protein
VVMESGESQVPNGMTGEDRTRNTKRYDCRRASVHQKVENNGEGTYNVYKNRENSTF